MQFFIFLWKTEFDGAGGFLPVKVSEGVQNAVSESNPFPYCDVYYENGEVIIGEPDSSKKSIFTCNDERALEVNNKIERNKEEDFLIMTDKVGFIENVKAYFRFIPFNGGILLCLYGGAIKLHNGEDWLVLSRNGKGTKEGVTVYPITAQEFVDSIVSSDETSGYNMVKDGVSSCEVYFANSSKFGVTKKTRSYRDEFTLLDDTNLKKAMREWERKEQELEIRNRELAERRKRYKIREEEFRRQEAEKEAEEKAKTKSKRTSTKKKAEPKPQDDLDAASAFISAVKKAGYTRN